MVKGDKSILDNEHIGRLLTRLTIPIFLANLVTTAYNFVDTIFVGHWVGPLAIGGIAFAMPVQMLFMMLAQMFGAGGASVISRAIGAGDRDRAERTLGNTFMIIAVCSVFFMILGLSNTVFWLKLAGASTDILSYANDYLQIILYGIFFQTFALTMSSLITAEGNTRVAMTGMIMGAVLNIIFDYVFIVVLLWGVKGAALGTVLAQLLSSIYLAFYYFRGRSYLKFHFRNLPLRWNIIWAMISIGSPMLLMGLSWTFSNIFINEALVVYGGGLAVSAYGIVSRLLSISTLPGMSIGQGMQPILGFNYGAKRYDRVLHVMKIAIASSTLIGIGIFVMLEIIPSQIAGIFTGDAGLMTLAAYAIRLVFSANIFTSVIISCIMTFQSLGKARQSFLISLRTLIFFLPFVLILPHFFKLDGVFYAYPASEVTGFILAVSLLVPQINQLRRLKAQNVSVQAIPAAPQKKLEPD